MPKREEDYTLYFSDLGVDVAAVRTVKSFKYRIVYYKLIRREDWQRCDRAKKKICKYLGGVPYDSYDTIEADFALAFPLAVNNWRTLEYLYSDYRLSHPEELAVGDFFMGQDIGGDWLWRNICDTRSILVAGSSGGGKSSLMNCIIDSLLRSSYNQKEQMQFDFIDLKQTELSYWGRFQQTVHSVATTKKEAAALLQDVKKEIERRYTIMNTGGIIKATPEQFPIYAIFIDEFSTLEAKEGTMINDLVRYITSVGRACNVFMVIATQHPKNSVIDNAIRANCATKIVLTCANTAQSTTICGQRIGVDLLGKGDAFLLLDGELKPIHFQAPLYDEKTREWSWYNSASDK